jgi:hypothetical protein
VKHAVRLAFVVCVLGTLPFAGSHTATPSITGQAPPPPNEAASGPATGTIRLLAVDKAGHPISGLKPEELRIRVNKEQRRILSVSSVADTPTTVGIFFDVSDSPNTEAGPTNDLSEVISGLHKIPNIAARGSTGFMMLFVPSDSRNLHRAAAKSSFWL